MLECVFAQVRRSNLITHVAIATDDDRIYRAAQAFGAETFMTDPRHNSGTERVAEVAGHFPDAALVVNVQGDEPFIRPEAIDQAITPMLDGAGNSSVPPLSTLKTALRSAEEAADPNVVKVVTDSAGRALYFSRARLPYQRDADSPDSVAWYKHLGLYVYQRDFLMRFPLLPRGPLETAEKLEQLRVLENGYSIQVIETEHDSLGVDTEADLDAARIHQFGE